MQGVGVLKALSFFENRIEEEHESAERLRLKRYRPLGASSSSRRLTAAVAAAPRSLQRADTSPALTTHFEPAETGVNGWEETSYDDHAAAASQDSPEVNGEAWAEEPPAAQEQTFAANYPSDSADAGWEEEAAPAVLAPPVLSAAWDEPVVTEGEKEVFGNVMEGSDSERRASDAPPARAPPSTPPTKPLMAGAGDPPAVAPRSTPPVPPAKVKEPAPPSVAPTTTTAPKVPPPRVAPMPKRIGGGPATQPRLAQPKAMPPKVQPKRMPPKVQPRRMPPKVQPKPTPKGKFNAAPKPKLKGFAPKPKWKAKAFAPKSFPKSAPKGAWMPKGGSTGQFPAQRPQRPSPPAFKRATSETAKLTEPTGSVGLSAEALGLEAILGRQMVGGTPQMKRHSSMRNPDTLQAELASGDLASPTPGKKGRLRPQSVRKNPLTGLFGTSRTRDMSGGNLDAYMSSLVGDDAIASSGDESDTGGGGKTDLTDQDFENWDNLAEEDGWPSDWGQVESLDINMVASEVWQMLDLTKAEEEGFKTEWGRNNVSYERPPTDGQAVIEYTTRDIQFYGDRLRSADHELAVSGGDGGADHVVVAFDCPSKTRTAIRIMAINKKKTYRTVLRGVSNRKEVFKKLTSGEVFPDSGLKGVKDLVSVKSTVSKSDHGSAEICAAIDKLEKSEIISTFKWGVLNVRAGQVEENEMYSNIHEESSPDYLEFLQFLGQEVVLDGWSKYRGGLDNRGTNATGEKSVYTEHRGFEIMYHVATLLPFQPDDLQRVERKRHLGNDITAIMFREQDAPPFDPCVLTTQFTNIFCVVSVAYRDEATNEPWYQVVISNKTGMPPYGPYIAEPPLYRKGDPAFRDMLLTKLINGERCALFRAPDFKFKMQRTRKHMLEDMAKPYLK